MGVLKMAVRNDVRHLSGSGAVACGSRGLPESFVQCLGIGGGFAALGVGCRRVVGVLDPHVVQFPPIAGAEAASGADVAPRVQTASAKTLKTGCSGRGGLRFRLYGAGHGARGWAGAPVGERAHERIRVWVMGHVCGAVGWVFPQSAPPQAKRIRKTKTPKQKLRGLAGGSDRRRSGDLSIFSRTLYQLSYRAKT